MSMGTQEPCERPSTIFADFHPGWVHSATKANFHGVEGSASSFSYLTCDSACIIVDSVTVPSLFVYADLHKADDSETYEDFAELKVRSDP